jgi:tRNA uridine 5-carbamoylmethylation protein Kti12
MKNVFILVGYPCSGKSTFAKQWHKSHMNSVVISYDSIIEEYISENDGLTYDKIFTNETHIDNVTKTFVAKMLLCDKTSDYLLEYVIIDTTNLTYKKRKVIYDIFKNDKKYLILFDTSSDIIFDRVSKRNNESFVKIPFSFITFLKMNFGFNKIRKDIDFKWWYRRLHDIEIIDIDKISKNMIFKELETVLID